MEREKKEVMRLSKYAKAITQVALLIAGVALLCFGIMRGEADLVLGKAIRLCLECIGIG
mgnify:CR=1 FL=1